MPGLSFEVRTSEAKSRTGQMFAPLQLVQACSATQERLTTTGLVD
jgi:hypothetical protein